MDPFTAGALSVFGRELATEMVKNSTCASCHEIKWNVVHAWSCCRKAQCPSCAKRTKSSKRCSVCDSKIQ
jgi:hypothetical protein